MSTKCISSATHLQGPKSNIYIYVHFHLVNKHHLTSPIYSREVKPSMKHVSNLEVRNNNK